MSASINTKVLVVGGGPGGYVAAIRAGQLGLDCVLIEADRLGGTCLTRGCIPSKALIHAAAKLEAITGCVGAGSCGISLREPPALDLAQTVRWKDSVVSKLNHGVAGLLKRAKVRVLQGTARMKNGKACELVQGPDAGTVVHAEHLILATGSVPVELPGLPFGGAVISSTEALSLAALPAHLVVVGAGYIGLELGIAYRKFGARVTVIEAAGRILPSYDEELTQPVRRWLQQAGVTLHLGAKVIGLRETADGARLKLQSAAGESEIAADRILVAAGRKPATSGWGLENLALDMNGPFIKVDAQCRTSMRDVWAIGDLTGEPMLAHKASAQGHVVAEAIAGSRRQFDPVAIPAVCFTEPEIVSAGLLPEQAATQGLDFITGQFPFAASGRALSMEAADSGGFVRVLARRDNHRILGIQAVGAHVSELAGEFTLALEMGAVLEDIAGTIHQHPTLGEALHESVLRTLGHAIHI